MPKKETVRDRSKVKPQGEDAAFLVEEFDMQPREAAELVAPEGADPDEVVQAARRSVKKHDAMKGKPTPEAAKVITSDADEELLKPVIREENRRTSGG